LSATAIRYNQFKITICRINNLNRCIVDNHKESCQARRETQQIQPPIPSAIPGSS